MSTERRLPKFRRPPLIEVVHGVQFNPLPITVAHPGLFFLRVRDQYPVAQSVPPLPPIQNFTVPQAFQLQFGPAVELPRAWFVSSDDAMLVQLQPDRLLLNWRRGANNAEYPHFEQVTQEFQRIYGELEIFVREQGLGQITPNHAEMAYINHLHAPLTEEAMPDPATILTLWSGKMGDDCQRRLSNLAFSGTFPMQGAEAGVRGRLSLAVSTLTAPARPERMLQLELTARGPIGGELKDVLEFHQLAHEEIVCCFAAITTKQAQEEWERVQ